MWPATRRDGLRAPRTAPHRRFSSGPSAGPDPAPAEGPGALWPAPWPSLYEGEPEVCRRDLRHFLPVAAHLGLMVALFKVWDLEGSAFVRLLLATAAALPAHYAAPLWWKKPVFVAASVLALAWAFGLAAAAAAVGLAAVLVGVCYLPVAWAARAALVAAVAAVCALARAGYAPATEAVVPGHLWPLLATLFMFRMVVYLYELKHAKRPEPLADTLSYFFLLPNFYFRLFPVVDYRTFQRSHFARDVHATMRSGLRMMARGAAQLLLYRVVYHRLLVPADEVRGPAMLAGFLVCNYLLYLHVSGQFHVACGVLHLFGFGLPETHRNYFLASSFTDYWRRINIYWKDFMVRVAFNPVVFALKRRPQPVALAAATAVVFVLTWALHAYQSFWLRGAWGFSGPDALFWGVLGGLVMVNVQLDARRSRRGPKAKAPSRDAGADAYALAARGAKTAGTFVTLALLWSLWNSPTVGDWLALLGRGLGAG